MSSYISQPFQQKFMTTNVYKRSKNYFDIQRINRIQQREQLQRRKPKTQHTLESVDIKFQESFVSAQVRLESRVQTEIDKQRIKYFRQDDDDDIDTTFSNTTGKKGKTLDMSKMLPRHYFQKQSKIAKNESHFCNFKEYKLPQNHTIDFQKLFPIKVVKKQPTNSECLRCTKKQKTLPSQSHIKEDQDSKQLGKIQEKLIFDQSIFRTLVDLKKYNKQVTSRNPNVELQKDEERIKLGQRMTKKMYNAGMCQFYYGSNKWNAHQMDNKLCKQNEFFLAHYNKKNEKYLDWTVIKRKVDLIQKKKSEIMGRKKIQDVKGEICDGLYFRRNH